MNIKYLILQSLVLFPIGNCQQTPAEKETEQKKLELVWDFEYEKESASISSVATAPTIINNNYLLLSIDYAITMLSLDGGNSIWRYDLPEKSRVGVNQLIYDENYIFLKHSKNKSAVALNIYNGKIEWESTIPKGEFFDFQLDGISDDKVYFSGRTQELFEFSKKGTLLRTIQYNYGSRSVISYSNNDLIISHAFTDSSPFAFGQIIRYDLDADTVKWKYETSSGGYYYTSILLEEAIIYGGTTEGPGEFASLDSKNGSIIWKKDNLQAWSYVLGKEAIFINEGADLVALNKDNGQQLWRTKFPGGGFNQTNLAYMDGYVYHSHSGSFFVLDAQTGEIVYSTVLPDRSYAGNVSAGFGKVFVQSDYHLFCYKGWEAE